MNPATREGITMPHYTPPRSTLLWLQRQIQRDPSLAAVLYAAEDPQSIYRFIAWAQRRRLLRTSHLWLRSNLPDDELANRITVRSCAANPQNPERVEGCNPNSPAE